MRRRIAGLAAVAAVAIAAPAGGRTTHLTIEVNGDLLIHSPIYALARRDGHGAYDFRPMLRVVRHWIRSADLAICHVETPMTPRAPASYPVFNTPPALAGAIRWAGWRMCDTASNHSLDQGQYGVDQTGVALSRAGVLHTGSSPSAAAQRRIAMVRVKGVRVALLAFTEMTNGEALPHRWSVNLARVGLVRRLARLARARGAQVVIVNFHWGDENVAAPSPFQRSLARALAGDRDITAIVGQHVHVVQPIRPVGSRLVVFGEGNLLSNQTAACCPAASQDGMLDLLHIDVGARRARVVSIAYVPIWTRHPDFLVVPVADGLRDHLAPVGDLIASFRRTVAVAGRIPGRVGPIPARA